MNLIHRSIWNDQTGTFVAVSENTRSAGKRASSCTTASGGHARFGLNILAVSLMMACGANVFAQPAGGVVSAGSATIGGTSGNMTITQTTPNVAINWQSFGIKAGESVQFVQPGSSSVALNRVIGSDPSSILGSLTANGKVFLVNPNGILFGQGASVNVGGLVASTLAITDVNFMANNYKFFGAGTGSVVNHGTINATDGGYVALLGANVSNQGVIAAQLGTVALAAGNAVTLDMAGDKLLNVTVDQGAVNALVDNGGMIRADGGQVLMTTQAAGSLLANAVNNTGVVQAQTLVTGENGTIMLMGGMESGTVNVGGTLDASAPKGGNGGFIETSAAHVKVADNTKITTLATSTGKTGTWLIDPMDYNVSVGGGDITGAQLGTNLESTSVTIQSIKGAGGTLGNVNVNDAVSWTAPTTLTMQAVNDVNINAAISGTNGSVDAQAGNNVNVAAATKTTSGNLSFTAVNDVLISAATTISTGNLAVVAGRNVTLAAVSTITTGDMILRADNDGTGPGAAAGTVAITCGSNCLTITTGNLSIRFNPVSYATTGAEIAAYDASLTGAGVLDAKAWVFGKGDNKMYDNTRAANVSGLKADLSGVVPAPTLGTVSNALFDTEHVGTNKPITYGATFNDAVYDLFAPVGFTPGTYLTRADILVRPLTVNAVTDTRVYNGTTSSVGKPTVVDLQSGDTLNGTLTQAYASKDVLGIGKSTLVANGPYTVSDGNGGNNYSITVNTAPGTISPADLVVTADDQTKTYGTNFVFSGSEFSSLGLQSPDSITAVTLVSSGAQASAHVAASPYPITPSAATGSFNSSNYTIRYVDGAMVVTPAPLTVTANDQTKPYGTAFPFTGTEFTSRGLLNTDTIGSATLLSPGTPATAPVAGSPYPIVPSAATGGTFTPGDYNITYVNGVLTVTPVPLTLTANDATKVYGQTITLPSSAFTSVGLKNDDTISSVTETSPGTVATAPVGNSPYAVSITPGSATGGTFVPSNYTIAYLPGKLTVTPVVTVPPVVTPPVDTTPVDSTPVDTTPVDSTPVDTTPVDSTPVATTPVDSTPVDSTSGELTPLPDTPYEGPTVKPRVTGPGWMPVVVTAKTPPQLLTLMPPVPPIVVPVQKPVVVTEQPPVIETPPTPYVAPKRPRKQDRN